MRELRFVPPALSDIPGDGGGAVLAARSHRRDARRRPGRAAGRRRVRRLRRDLCAVPRVRNRVPERGAVRCADGGDPVGARRRGADHALVATDWLPCVAAPSAAAGRLDDAGGRTAPATRAEAPRCAAAAAATRSEGRGDRRRRVAVHRVCDGCVATRDASQHRHAGGAHGGHGCCVRPERRLLWGVARARGAPRRGGVAGRTGDGVDAGRRADPRELRRVRRLDEGLRDAGGHGRRPPVQRPGARHLRVARRPARPVARGDGPPSDGDRAGSLPSPSRPTRSPTGAGRARPRRRGRRARRRRALLRGGRRLLGAAAGARRARP